MSLTDNRFPVSGLPNYLEWYRCYEDLSKPEPVDGMELWRNKNSWSEKQKAKWRYFYRPVRAWVGRPQKKRIRQREARIVATQIQIEKEANSLKLFLVFVFLSGVVSLLISGYLILIAGLVGALGRKHYKRRQKLMRDLIDDISTEIEKLQLEISLLIRQVPPPTHDSAVEDWLKCEMQSLEKSCLAELVNVAPSDPNLFNRIRHEPLENEIHNRYELHGLLIESWGIIQPAELLGPFGKERTGLNRVLEDLGPHAAAFRVGTTGQPINRVPHLQFIFLLRNNVNVCSLLYDFVTGTEFGKRSQTFQYGHVTNYALRAVEMDEDRLVKQFQLPESLAANLTGKEAVAFFLAVASGAYFSCVLMDEVLIETINEWIDADLDTQRAETQLEDFQDLDGSFEGLSFRERNALRGRSQQLRADWVERKRLELEESLRKKTEWRRYVERGRIHLAQRVLQQIREEIEDYVHGISGKSIGL